MWTSWVAYLPRAQNRTIPPRLAHAKLMFVLEASFAGAFQQTKQRRSLCRAGPAPDDDDDAVMRLAFRQVDEVVAVAGHQKTTVFLCKLEDNEIFGLLLEHIAKARDFVAEFLE